jgi:transcriptional regulator with XRE-family HTH domain
MARPRKKVDTGTYTGRFAERLKKLREKTKLSVEEFSVKSGIPRTTLHNWEQGIRNPPFDILPQLADALGVKVRILMPEK